MKNPKIYIALLISSFFVSCIDVEEKPSEQQLTDLQIEKVEKIIVTDKSSGRENSLKEGNELMGIRQFFKDSTNYFPSDQIKSS